MKNGMLITMLLGTSVVALAQSNQEPGAAPLSKVTQTQIVELHRSPIPEWLILFDLATKDEQGMCKVHHHPLKVATIPVIYGLLAGVDKESYSRAEAEEFPNAITRYEAGCLMSDAKEAKVLQCQKCLEAKKDWTTSQRGIFEPKPNRPKQ